MRSAPSALHGIKAVAPGLDQNTHTIYHRIRALHHGTHRGIIADIAENRLYLPNSAVRFDMQRLIGVAHSHPHPPPGLCHAPRNIPPDKPRPAIDRYQLGHERSPPQICLGFEYSRTPGFTSQISFLHRSAFFAALPR
jgi:hypothetical protein